MELTGSRGENGSEGSDSDVLDQLDKANRKLKQQNFTLLEQLQVQRLLEASSASSAPKIRSGFRHGISKGLEVDVVL
jgi:hypothetical protein